LHPHFINVTDIRFYKNDSGVVYKAIVYLDDVTIVEEHIQGTAYTGVSQYSGDLVPANRISYLTTELFKRNI
jgi:hypothetical protein